MKKDLKSLNAQVEIGTDFWNIFRVLFGFVFVFFFITPFSAQEVKSEESVRSEAVISIVGDAFIYSKDEAFNEQISKNKDLQKNYKVELTQNNGLKISAKSINNLSEEVNPNKRKTENIVLASKKVSKHKSVYFPKKDIHQQVKDLDENNKFFLGSIFGNSSFISPSNDSHLFKFFIGFTQLPESICLKYLHSINYFYRNSDSKLQSFTNDFSVRPPPSLI